MERLVSKTHGFTLIELMLVVAIIGLLAAIAIPKFANLVIKAKEAATKGKLGTVRSAVSIYYADNEGKYPSAWQYFAACLTTGGRYLDAIPQSEIPTVTPPHRGNGIGQQSFPSDIEFQVAGQAWHFNSLNGRISVNCTHTDSKGTTWSLW